MSWVAAPLFPQPASQGVKATEQQGSVEKSQGSSGKAGSGKAGKGGGGGGSAKASAGEGSSGRKGMSEAMGTLFKELSIGSLVEDSTPRLDRAKAFLDHVRAGLEVRTFHQQCLILV